MEIKIKDKTYKTIKVPKYNKLIGKLEVLLQDNRHPRKYHGIVNEGKIGILVCGIGSSGIREFERFYSINDINFYFNKHIQRLKKHGEWRLSGVSPR